MGTVHVRKLDIVRCLHLLTLAGLSLGQDHRGPWVIFVERFEHLGDKALYKNQFLYYDASEKLQTVNSFLVNSLPWYYVAWIVDCTDYLCAICIRERCMHSRKQRIGIEHFPKQILSPICKDIYTLSKRV